MPGVHSSSTDKVQNNSTEMMPVRTALCKGWNREEWAKAPHGAAFHQLQCRSICSWTTPVCFYHSLLPLWNDGYALGRKNSTSLLLTGPASYPPLHPPTPGRVSPCQPANTSATTLVSPSPCSPSPLDISPLSFATDHCRPLLSVLVLRSLKGLCKQSLTPHRNQTST